MSDSSPSSIPEPSELPTEAAILPATEANPFRSLDRNVIITERIAGGILFSALLVALLVYAAIGMVWSWIAGNKIPEFYFWFGLMAGGSIVGLLGWLGFVWPVWSHRHASWRLTSQGLEIKRGIWWKHHIAIPRDRVQHTDVEQGPLMRKYDVAKLVVHTAGTHHSSIALEGLHVADAQKLRSELTEKRVAGS